jgi:malonyl CoA-acyl carrier protein transacylase
MDGKVAALFAGQGSQYLNMFDDVAMNWPEFRQAVVDMDVAAKVRGFYFVFSMF